MQSARLKPPFGIAQIGKSFRNEITPGNFVFRTREFEQAEMEFFVPPAENDKWYAYWKARALPVVLDLGIDPAQLRLREHAARARALLDRHLRHRVRVPLRLGRARGHRLPHRLRPEAPLEASASTCSTSIPRPRSATSRS
jgi:hypothetical protein